MGGFRVQFRGLVGGDLGGSANDNSTAKQDV